MTDVFSKRKRSQVMAAVRGRANRSTELRLVRIFRKNRIRGWRRHSSIAGNADFMFRERRLVVFVDGCFWHGCPKHLRMPKSNTKYWRRKIDCNRVRDTSVSKLLRQRGWTVLRIWEHELRNEARLLRRIRLAMNLKESND